MAASTPSRTVDFAELYRRLDQAANFIVTLETRVKASGKSSTSPSKKWTPVPETSSTVETEPIPTPKP